MVVAQLALVPSQLLGSMFERHIERWIRVVRFASALKLQAMADMDGNISAEQMGIAGKHNGSIYGLIKIFCHGRPEIGLGVLTQCITDIELLTSY